MLVGRRYSRRCMSTSTGTGHSTARRPLQMHQRVGSRHFPQRTAPRSTTLRLTNDSILSDRVALRKPDDARSPSQVVAHVSRVVDLSQGRFPAGASPCCGWEIQAAEGFGQDSQDEQDAQKPSGTGFHPVHRVHPVETRAVSSDNTEMRPFRALAQESHCDFPSNPLSSSPVQRPVRPHTFASQTTKLRRPDTP